MAGVDLKNKITVSPKITSCKITDESKTEIKWKGSPLAEKYDIKRSLSPNSDFVHVDWATGTSFVDSLPERDTTYWYKVVAWKRMENKKTSQKASSVAAVTLSDIPCVKNVSASAEKGNILLKWDKGEGDRYYIYRRNDCCSRMFLIGESRKDSFLDENAVSGQIYHYTVQTVKDSDKRELHGNFSKPVKCAFIDTTEILSAKRVFGKRNLIDVKVIAGADGYILERSDKKDGDFVEVGRNEGITEVSFEDKVTSRLKTHYYRVCAFKKIGKEESKGAYSDVKAVR